jgi:hypothetical protein
MQRKVAEGEENVMTEREPSNSEGEIEVDEAVELPEREAMSLIDVGGVTPLPAEPFDVERNAPPGKLPGPA